NSILNTQYSIHEEMNILFVTPRLPLPADTGAKIRTLNLLKQVKSRGNRVILLSFIYTEDDSRYIKAFEDMGIKVLSVEGRDTIHFSTLAKAFLKRIPLTIAKYLNKNMAVTLRGAIVQYQIDVVHFDHLHLSQYAQFCKGVETIIDEHNVESTILKRYAQHQRNPLKRLLLKSEYRKMSVFEKKQCHSASRVLVVSHTDKSILEKICEDGLRIEVIPNGVDADYFHPPQTVHHSQEEDSIVFVGSLDWFPNSDAVSYFCSQILPYIWKKLPHTKFYIVGRNPPARIRNFAKCQSRIIVVGKAEDIRLYVAKAKVFVVPLRIGGGTRLKILEALAMKKCVVSTSVGAEGLKVKDAEHLLIADTALDFARKVVMLMSSKEARQKLTHQGRGLVAQVYDWKIIGGKLNEVYGGLMHASNQR
ncbi:MAG: glycosyltransferase, partial [Candidatus Omnitrophota bacterium]